MVYLVQTNNAHVSLPSPFIPSLSIVVGLMLVFRNQTSYDRFWSGQQNLTTICSCVRNLSRSFLTCSYVSGQQQSSPSAAEVQDVEHVIRVMLALLYAVKTHLRSEWETTLASVVAGRGLGSEADSKPDIHDLLPPGMQSFEREGLGLPLQLSIEIEGFIKRGHDRTWFHAPQASQLTVQLNTAIAAFGAMETIRLTPIPVAYLIHTKQVLALFGCLLPFAMVSDMGWWSVLLVSLITFTLYGIEAIGQQIEDPFGYDRADIKLDACVEDLRVEVMVMLDQWRSQGSIFANARS